MNKQITLTYTLTGMLSQAQAKEEMKAKLADMQAQKVTLETALSSGVYRDQALTDKKAARLRENLTKLTTQLADTPMAREDLTPLKKYANADMSTVILIPKTRAEAIAMNLVLMSCRPVEECYGIEGSVFPACVNSSRRAAGMKEDGTIITGTHYSCKSVRSDEAPTAELPRDVAELAHETWKNLPPREKHTAPKPDTVHVSSAPTQEQVSEAKKKFGWKVAGAAAGLVVAGAAAGWGIGKLLGR